MPRTVFDHNLAFLAAAGAKPMYDDQGFDVADDLDQATGLQHAELVADILDKPFFQEALIQGPFGTAENPVLIESTLGYRIVGCTGADPAPRSRALALHPVTGRQRALARPIACRDCASASAPSAEPFCRA